jgi:phage terminase large subunit-like protein
MYLVEELAKEHFPNQYSDDVLGINVSEYVYLMNKSLDKLLDKALDK